MTTITPEPETQDEITMMNYVSEIYALKRQNLALLSALKKLRFAVVHGAGDQDWQDRIAQARAAIEQADPDYPFA
jgi:hypothetical protein